MPFWHSVCFLTAEIIVMYVFGIDAERVKHFVNSRTHRSGSTHVIFNIFRRIMIFEVCVINNLMNKSGSIFHARSIGCRIGTVKSQMEVEVGEFLSARAP